MADPQEQEAADQYRSDAALRTLCEEAGISVDQFLSSRLSVRCIEVCFQNASIGPPVGAFPGLQELALIRCKIESITFLENCPQLRKLWLPENLIEEISGLEHVPMLEELYLNNNGIKRISGLSTLSHLRVLWLNENAISVIENLELLDRLDTLWIAMNQIEIIDESLLHNTQLTEINLAGNRIGSFRCLNVLRRMQNLQSVCLDEPHFGPNPLCLLCNYQTYALYALPRVTFLDTKRISEEARRLADATVIKKRMYYNMRIKTLKRNTSNVIRRGRILHHRVLRRLDVNLSALYHEQLVLTRELEDLTTGRGPMFNAQNEYLGPSYVGFESHASHLEACKAKLEQAKSLLQNRLFRMHSANRAMSLFKAHAEHISVMNISRLVIELETGGNIRMEEGKPTDVWYTSCVDLMRNRFFQSSAALSGSPASPASPDITSSTDRPSVLAGMIPLLEVEGLRITRVVRIHNRMLRNRFEEALAELVDVSDTSYKKSLEYLFYGQSPEDPAEVFRILESGFPTSEAFERGLSPDHSAGVPLTNSLAICDLPRLKKLTEHVSTRDASDFPPGYILITKVFLGKMCPDPATLGRAAGTQREPLPPLRREEFAEYDSAYRCSSHDPKQRTWHVFDRALCLPEYLVEFEYTNEHHCTWEEESADELMSLLEPQSEGDVMDIRALAPAFAKFQKGLKKLTVDLESADGSLPPEEDAAVLQLRDSPPHIPDRRKAGVLTWDLIDTLAVPSSPEDESAGPGLSLNLLEQGISSVDNLSGNITHLVLAFNQLTSMAGIQECKNLVHLDVSFNSIRRMDGLDGLSKLRDLLINNNQIHRLEDINMLKRHTPQLVVLNLRKNSICDVKNYRQLLVRRLAMLETLDGMIVTSEERIRAGEKMSVITQDLVLRCGRLTVRDSDSLASSYEQTTPLLEFFFLPSSPSAVTSPAGSGSSSRGMGPIRRSEENILSRSKITDATWMERLVELDLSRMRIRKIQCLDLLFGLRKLNLMDNEISRIEGLTSLVRLEELSLEDNRISSMEGLAGLACLRKLELGKNKLTSISCLDTLQNLLVLSVEDNDISSLDGVQRCRTLMEFYAGNNRADDVREISLLKDVPRLIILELWGNPLTRNQEYRLFTVWHLHRLKVLDGVSIDGRETAKAKEAFSGKITLEFLEEHLGHGVDKQNLRELNLCQCGIKDTSMLQDLPNLRELYLDHNQLTDFRGLNQIQSLVVLSVQHNKISTPHPNAPEPVIISSSFP